MKSGIYDSRRSWGGRLFLLLLMLGLALLPGCGGCNPEDPEEAKAKAKAAKLKKRDWEPLTLKVQPHDKDTVLQGVKPGHWINAALAAQTNNFDFTGELEAAVVDSSGDPVQLENTPFRLDTSRTASLPKGQPKQLELTFFIPRGRSKTQLACDLLDRRRGTRIKQHGEFFQHMPAYQYYMVVWSSDPLRYGYLKRLDSVRPPLPFVGLGNDAFYYRVIMPDPKQPVPVPSQPLCWSSIAYVVCDDAHPSALRKDQQQAMIDWLHWGGQLILSGPKTLDNLRGTFLEKYLPAANGGSTVLRAAELAELSRTWTISSDSGGLNPATPFAAVKLDRHPQAQFLEGCGNLVAERAVGRGRIVVTSFRLVDRELLNWAGFDNFFNACILRRPARRFVEDGLLSVDVRWNDEQHSAIDPRYVTAVRYFSHDAGNFPYGRGATPPSPENDFGEVLEDSVIAESRQHSGVAGWSDFGEVSSAARDSLKEAAGIVIPRRDFVLRVLGWYLLVLVPLNWVVFRFLGRVELAWVAAPFIAIVFAILVIWQAQLDIGFARSTTEIAVLELQPNYPRAHVTRYSALYTSLSTAYDLHYSEPSALAQPFATDANFQMLVGQGGSVVNYRRDRNVSLTGFTVASNSTGMVHSEYMADLGGEIAWDVDDAGRQRIVNRMPFRILGAGVVRRIEGSGKDPEKGLERIWLGTIAPGGSESVDLDGWREELTAAELLQKQSTDRVRPTLNLRKLLNVADQGSDLAPGDARLVGWVDHAIAGMESDPRAAQTRSATMIVANLAYGRAVPKSDWNERKKPEIDPDAEPVLEDSENVLSSQTTP